MSIIRTMYEYEPYVNIRGTRERASPTHRARAHLPLALPRLCLVHSIKCFFRLFQIAITRVPERGAARWWQVMTTRGTTGHERWGAGVEYHFQEFNEPYAPS